MQYLYWRTNLPRNIQGTFKKIAPGGKNTWKKTYSDVLKLLEGKKTVISYDGSLQEQRTIRHVFMSLFPRRMSMVMALDISGQLLIILPPNCELLSFGTTSGFYVTYLTLPACLSPITNAKLSQNSHGIQQKKLNKQYNHQPPCEQDNPRSS